MCFISEVYNFISEVWNRVGGQWVSPWMPSNLTVDESFKDGEGLLWVSKEESFRK